MEREIIWLDKAVDSYFNILNYIETYFGNLVAEKFIFHVNETLNLIIDYPLLGKAEFESSKVRGVIIEKKTTLYYKLENNKVILLKFFDHRQHPSKKLN
jgi:plasmid stabilization system protein ParE